MINYLFLAFSMVRKTISKMIIGANHIFLSLHDCQAQVLEEGERILRGPIIIPHVIC